jgi:hypothetical protein
VQLDLAAQVLREAEPDGEREKKRRSEQQSM